ncbi:hypothetical protein FACS1894192_08010 [Bacilli bacterium]|nr:hypothetical protein FACS1894192_08010 [Bacilli bacterium]
MKNKKMSFRKWKSGKKWLYAATALAVLTGGVIVSTQSVSALVGGQNLEKPSIVKKAVNSVVKKDVTQNGTYYTFLKWDGAGKTEIIGEANTTGLGSAKNYYASIFMDWGAKNQFMRAEGKAFTLQAGTKIRFTNVAKDKEGRAVDIVITYNGFNPNGVLPPSVGFDDTDFIGTNGTTNLTSHGIGGNYAGVQAIDSSISYYLHGTNTPVSLGVIALWSDIDVKQGLHETQSNLGAFAPNVTTLNNYEGPQFPDNFVATTDWTDYDGEEGLSKTAYYGVGKGSSLRMAFQAPYEFGGVNVGARDQIIASNVAGFRLDILGQPKDFEIPKPDVPEPPAPTKSVTDGSADINGKTTTPDKSWVYHVKQEVPTLDKMIGTKYATFTIHDDVPASAKIQSVKVVTKNGTDVSSDGPNKRFNVTVNGQSVEAKANAALGADAFYGETYDMVITTLVDISDQTKTGTQLKADNAATSTFTGPEDKSWAKTTNHVTSEPKFVAPTIKKSVSLDGKNWVNSATLSGFTQKYEYKVDYTLSDHVDYASLTLSDPLEDIQTFDSVKVVDSSGKDISSSGKWTLNGTEVTNPSAALKALKASEDGKKAQVSLKWTANTPSIYTRVGGNIALQFSGVTLNDADAADLKPYIDDSMVVVPNVSALDYKDTTPATNEPGHLDSNKVDVKVKVPSAPPTPVKTVTDGGKDINGSVTTPNTHWIFDVAQEVPADGAYLEFVMGDDVPTTAKIQSVKIIDEKGNDAADRLTLKQSGNKITATAKTDKLNDLNSDFYGHTYHIVIDTLVNIDDQKQTAEELKTDNTGTTTGKTLDDKPWSKVTNKVTVTPKFNTPSVKKAVAKEGGNYVTDEILDTHNQKYNYKIDYQLTDHADYSSLTLNDPLEDIQVFDSAKILDAKGNDITATGKWFVNGKETANPAESVKALGVYNDGKKGKVTLSWQANDPSKYTRVGGTLVMYILGTTLSQANATDEVAYISGGKEIVPDTANMDWVDKTPTADEPKHLESNKVTVTPPKPTDVAADKKVSVDGGKTFVKDGDLPSHDANYDWKNTFTLSKFNNFDELILTDHFANVQLTNFDLAKDVKITQNGTDITSHFSLKVVEGKAGTNTVDIVATAKTPNEFDDITDAAMSQLIMTVSGQSLKGVTLESEKPFIKDDKEVIPNQSVIVVNPSVKDDLFSKSKETPIATVTPPKVTELEAVKDVSIDGGKTWATEKDLPNHDGLYTWRNTFKLTMYNNVEELVLSDHIANVQMPNIDLAKQVKILQNGKDITSHFTLSLGAKSGNNVDIVAVAKTPAEFDDITDVAMAKLEMIVSDVSLKGVDSKTETPFIKEGKETIPNQSKIQVNPTFDMSYFSKEKDTNIAKVNVTPPTPFEKTGSDGNKKEVSVDDEKTWLKADTPETAAALSEHDKEYSWKNTFDLPEYYNFDGEGALVITDHFENLQKDYAILIQDGEGNDITSWFTISGTNPKGGDGKIDIKAALKAQYADKFDDLGKNGTNLEKGKYSRITLIVRGATLKGATAKQELNYLTKGDTIVIPNQTTITATNNAKIDYWDMVGETNKSHVRPPMIKPIIEKFVEGNPASDGSLDVQEGITGDEKDPVNNMPKPDKDKEVDPDTGKTEAQNMEEVIDIANTFMTNVYDAYKAANQPVPNKVEVVIQALLALDPAKNDKVTVKELSQVIADLKNTVESDGFVVSSSYEVIKVTSEMVEKANAENAAAVKAANQAMSKAYETYEKLKEDYPTAVKAAVEKIVSLDTSKLEEPSYAQLVENTKAINKAVEALNEAVKKDLADRTSESAAKK